MRPNSQIVTATVVKLAAPIQDARLSASHAARAKRAAIVAIQQAAQYSTSARFGCMMGSVPHWPCAARDACL